MDRAIASRAQGSRARLGRMLDPPSCPHIAEPAGNDEFYLLGRVPKEVLSQLTSRA